MTKSDYYYTLTPIFFRHKTQTRIENTVNIIFPVNPESRKY